MRLHDFYPIIVTDKLAECRDFYTRRLGFQPAFEASWFVYLASAGDRPHGIAFMAAQARACLPARYSLTLAAWHCAQVSGVGSFTLATSEADLWAEPWQVEQSCFFPILPERNCFTIPGVTFSWQTMHSDFLTFVVFAARTGETERATRETVIRTANHLNNCLSMCSSFSAV